MLTRRELVTGSAMGAIATATPTTAAPDSLPQEVDNASIRRIAEKAAEIDQTLDGLAGAFRTNTLAYGYVPKLREAYTLYWRTHGKFPEFCEVGTDVFYDLYDWHIKNSQPIPVSRSADGRMAINFMFTQLLVRTDQAPTYIGLPFDRQ